MASRLPCRDKWQNFFSRSRAHGNRTLALQSIFAFYVSHLLIKARQLQLILPACTDQRLSYLYSRTSKLTSSILLNEDKIVPVCGSLICQKSSSAKSHIIKRQLFSPKTPREPVAFAPRCVFIMIIAETDDARAPHFRLCSGNIFHQLQNCKAIPSSFFVGNFIEKCFDISIVRRCFRFCHIIYLQICHAISKPYSPSSFLQNM